MHSKLLESDNALQPCNIGTGSLLSIPQQVSGLNMLFDGDGSLKKYMTRSKDMASSSVGKSKPNSISSSRYSIDAQSHDKDQLEKVGSLIIPNTGMICSSPGRRVSLN